MRFNQLFILSNKKTFQFKGDFYMIFKVYYQEEKKFSPQREKTKSLYVEGEDSVSVRRLLAEKTDYNVELIQPLEGNHLDYEKENADFTLVEFN